MTKQRLTDPDDDLDEGDLSSVQGWAKEDAVRKRRNKKKREKKMFDEKLLLLYFIRITI